MPTRNGLKDGGGGGAGDIESVTVTSGGLLSGGGTSGDVNIASRFDNPITWTAAHTFNPGTSQSTPIFLDMAQPGSNGQRDSHALQLRGTAYDGAGHNADWRMFADVTSNAGDSTFVVQNRKDVAGFATWLSISDVGLVTVAGKITGVTQATSATDAVAGGRTISAGTGMTGGGDLTANRTLSVDTSTIATRSYVDTQDGTLVPKTRTITAGAGLTGTGDLSADRTFDVGQGTGITVNANDVAVDTSVIAVTARNLIAGGGLTGGGTLAADRTFAVGAGTGITVNADDVAIDQTFAPTWTGTHTWSTTDGGTTTTTRKRVDQHRSSGTPAAGFGVGQQWALDSSNNTLRTAGQLDITWITATNTSETTKASLYLLGLNGTTPSALPTTPTVSWSSEAGQTIFITDTATSTTTDLLVLDHRSTGTAAGNYGTGILFRGQDASATAGGDDLIRLLGSWNTATSGAEVSQLQVQMRQAGGVLTTGMTIAGAGTTTIVGSVTAPTFQLTSGSLAITISANLISHTMANSRFGHIYTRTAPVSGADQMLKYTTGGSTGRTASTEIVEFDYNIGTRQWAAGAITTQREFLVRQPTYSFVSASTITQAATVAIVGMPVAGTNATITESMSLWTQDGLVRHDLTDAATNAVTNVLILDHRSSGTTAANFGTGLLFRGQDSAGTAGGDDMLALQASWSNATSGAESSQLRILTRAAGGAISSVAVLASDGSFTTNGTITSPTWQLSSGSLATTISANTVTHTMANSRFGHTYLRTAPTSGSDKFFLYTPGNSTGRTASTEIPEFDYNIGTKQWAAGALTTQREVVFRQPTYSFVSASTITQAATVAIVGMPVASTNATITETMSFWTQDGIVRHDLVDAATSTNTDVLILEHRSSGTVAANFGTGLLFRGQDASATAGGDDIVRLSSIFTSATSGAEITQLNIQTRTGGSALANALTINASVTTAAVLGTTSSFNFNGNSMVITGAGSTIQYALSNSRFTHQYTRAAPISGSVSYFLYQPGSSTGRTASTEIIEYSYVANSTQWAAGALTTQRNIVIAAPTYSFVSASTITTAANLAIGGAPIASTNATITKSLALWVQSGLTQLDGRLIAQAPDSAIVDADLPVSSWSAYLNEAGNTLVFKAKYAGGTVKTGTVALT